MGKFFSKSVEVNIDLMDAPIGNKYSPVNPIVRASISVNFHEEFKKICYFKSGVYGVADIVLHTTELEGHRGPESPNQTRKRKTFTERDIFFKAFKDFAADSDKIDAKISSELGMQTFTYRAGDQYETQIEIEIPNNVYLPSSCREFGDRNAHVNVGYAVYIEIYKFGGMFNKRPKLYETFSVPITYQSGKDPHYAQINQSLDYTMNEVYANKVKKFYFDETTQALIPSSLHNNHTRTKFIRKLWNDDYRTENYSRMTKSIPLNLEFVINSTLNLAEPLRNQFCLTLSSNLGAYNIESNQSTDFVYNGQSTHLGVFKIEYLLIEALYESTIECQRRRRRVDEKFMICRIDFTDLNVDIKDFEYNKQTGAYSYVVPMDDLTSAGDLDMNQRLVDMLESRAIMCAGIMSNWLSTSVQIKYTWKISDGMAQDKHIQFMTTSTPDFLFGNVNFNSVENNPPVYTPPLPYDTNGWDEKS